MAVYSTEELVRDGLGQLTEKNIHATFIEEAIKWASSDCDLFTGKAWLPGEQYYDTIAGCCQQLAVCYAITQQNDKDVRQMNQFKLAMERLNKINALLVANGTIPIPNTGLTEAGLVGIDYVPKQTYPMNPYGTEVYAVKRNRLTSEMGGERLITQDNSDFL